MHAVYHCLERPAMFSSLRTRIISICIAIVVIAMSTIVIGNFLTVRSNTLTSVDQQSYQLIAKSADNIATWINAKQMVVSSMAATVNADDPIPAMQAAKKAGVFTDTFIGYADKRAIFLYEKAAGYDPTIRPWFIQATQTNGPAITPPYIDLNSQKLVVSFLEPVDTNKNIKCSNRDLI